MASLEVCFPPQEETEMAKRDNSRFSNAQLKEIGEIIGEALDGATESISNAAVEKLRKEIDAFRPHGWKRLIHTAREIAPLGFNVTLIIALLALTANSIYQANSKAAEHAQFEQKTSDRLDAIEATLRLMRAAQSPTAVLRELDTLKPHQLALNLPALQKVTEQPIATVNPSAETLKGVGGRLLLVNENAPDYWPTILRFIQFASAKFAPDAPPDMGPERAMQMSNVQGYLKLPPKIVVYLNGGIIADQVFTDDRIVFTDSPVYFRNVHFIRCAFQFPHDLLSPSQPLRNTSRELLASGIESTYIAGE